VAACRGQNPSNMPRVPTDLRSVVHRLCRPNWGDRCPRRYESLRPEAGSRRQLPSRRYAQHPRRCIVCSEPRPAPRKMWHVWTHSSQTQQTMKTWHRVIRLPRIANFGDLDLLATEQDAHVRYVTQEHNLGSLASIIVPGTRSTIGDLEWLRSVGLAGAITDFACQGTPVVGICGGYQVLWRHLGDLRQVESSII